MGKENLDNVIERLVSEGKERINNYYLKYIYNCGMEICKIKNQTVVVSEFKINYRSIFSEYENITDDRIKSIIVSINDELSTYEKDLYNTFILKLSDMLK